MKILSMCLIVIMLAVLEVSCGGQPQDTLCVPPVPRLDKIEPQSVKTHSPSVLLTVYGTNFVPASVVFFDGHATVTTYVGPQQLRAVVPFDLLLKVGNVPVDVFNPQDGSSCFYGLSQDSNAVTFTLIP